MPAPHKLVLRDLLEQFAADLVRLEAALDRLDLVAPHSEPATDPAAIEAADRYIRERTLELRGGSDVE